MARPGIIRNSVKNSAIAVVTESHNFKINDPVSIAQTVKRILDRDQYIFPMSKVCVYDH
jgi:hypothetical protein